MEVEVAVLGSPALINLILASVNVKQHRNALFPQKLYGLLGTGGRMGLVLMIIMSYDIRDIVQELCESRGGRPGLSVLTFWFPWT